MVEDKDPWGVERIRVELLKLVIRVRKRTIQKYMRGGRPPCTQPIWNKFIANHSRDV